MAMRLDQAWPVAAAAARPAKRFSAKPFPAKPGPRPALLAGTERFPVSQNRADRPEFAQNRESRPFPIRIG